MIAVWASDKQVSEGLSRASDRRNELQGALTSHSLFPKGRLQLQGISFS